MTGADPLGLLVLLFAGIGLAAHFMRRSLRRRDDAHAAALDRTWRRHVG